MKIEVPSSKPNFAGTARLNDALNDDELFGKRGGRERKKRAMDHMRMRRDQEAMSPCAGWAFRKESCNDLATASRCGTSEASANTKVFVSRLREVKNFAEPIEN